MLVNLISGDKPRSWLLTLILVGVVVALAGAPFLFGGVKSLNAAAKICVFILLVASYDLLLGYTGVVSFAHTMFFGIGAYGVGIALSRMGPDWTAVALGGTVGVILAAALALAIALFSLRVRAIFFAMMTLAVASAFAILASQLYELTGGDDGLNFRLPELLTPRLRLGEVFGVKVTGVTIKYYVVFFSVAALFLALLRIVNSQFGTVLKAIRENEFRAEALGYRTVYYRTAATCLSAGFAALAGVLLALWSGNTGPEVTLSMAVMTDILLMVVIGGMGTMYGAILGASLFILAQTYLQELMGAASAALGETPLLPELINPDRWLLWLGVLFVLSVYFFPAGVVGQLRKWRWA